MAEASSRSETRARIVREAAALLVAHGPSAVTTRGVAEAAGVQAPTIYRLFGDKDGLLEAVAEHAMAVQVARKAAVVANATADGVDPLDDLRTGWLDQIEFGLANPALFRLLSDPDRVRESPAARSGRAVLRTRIHRVAVAGRLRVTEERATDLVQAAGIGVIQTLLSTSEDQRDGNLAEAMYAGVASQILTDPPAGAEHDGLGAAAIALRAGAPALDALSDGERRLLTEWLDRVIGRTPLVGPR